VRQFLTSGDAGQQVSDDGTFARLFIEALLGEQPADSNGDGYLTASELGAFLDGKMSNYTQNRQTPRFGKLRSPEFDKGDFVFALPGNDGPSAARKSITQSSGVTPDERVWRVVQNSTDPTDFMTFMRNFPDSPFIAFAKAKLKKLIRGRKVAKLTPPAGKPATDVASTGGDLENTLYMDLKDGRVVIELKPDLAPRHVARIKELTRQGFYDGIVFHRVIDNFMAQTGDPTGTGTGGSGQKLKAEFNNAKHVRGAVSMARARDLNSADSQFFIVYKNASFLDGQYTIWGQVTEGMEFVDRIKKGAGRSGSVENPDKIVRMRVAADVKG
jgi:peptidylprolyl isomerase